MSEFMNAQGLDLVAIRSHLNELQFEQGSRKLRIGRIADLFAEHSPAEIARELQNMRQKLAEHDLQLEEPTDPDQPLVVVQQLTQRPVDAQALARAMQWVSRITTVACEMVLPAVIGTWLDHRLGTNMLAVAGLLIGVPLGLWHLVQMTKS